MTDYILTAKTYLSMTNKYSFLILCLCLFFSHGICAQTNQINWTDQTSKIQNSTLDEGTDPEDDKSSAWQWVTSAKKGWRYTGLEGNGAWTPEVNRFYHMVGVYDREGGTITLYRDGQKMGNAVPAKGKMVFPYVSGATDPYKFQKFCFIGDPARPNYQEEDICGSAIPGEVVMARMYDKVLSEAEIQQLYKQAFPGSSMQGTTGSKDQASADLVTNVQYLSEVDALSSGSKFVIYADGLQSNDKITFTNANGSSSATKATTFTSRLNIMPAKTGMQRASAASTAALGSATCPLPNTAGTYKMTLTRGAQTQNLGYMRINSVVEKLNYGNTFGIVAHRGVHTSAPENSIEALKIAMENNLYGSETDVLRTSDNVIVVNHDMYFNNSTHKSSTSTSATPIETSKSSALASLTLTNGEKLPTLAEYLNAFKTYRDAHPECTTKLIIEIKRYKDAVANDNTTSEIGTQVCQQVFDAGLLDKTEFITFSYAACKAMATATYGGQHPVVYYLNTAKTNRSASELKTAGITGGTDYNRAPTYDGASVPNLLNQTTVAGCKYTDFKNAGLNVNVWTINTMSQANEVLRDGCDFITANNPIELIMLKEYIDLNNNIKQ